MANGIVVKTLELPWRNNMTGISCVPNGRYRMVYEWSPAFGMYLWEMKDVPGRTETKIHAGNFTRQIRGCILVGLDHIDIDGDGLMDVTSSKAALQLLHNTLKPYEGSEIFINITSYDLPNRSW